MKVAEPLVLVQLAKLLNNYLITYNKHKPASAGFVFIFLSLFYIYAIFIYMNENSTTNVTRETYNGLKNVQYAKLFPRFVSVIVDLAITAFVFFGFLLFTQNVICKNSVYVKNAEAEFYGYNVDSGLFEYKEDGVTLQEKTFDSYKGYEDLFYSYYTDYLVNECPEKYRVSYDGLDKYWFNVHVLGQPDARAKYSDLDKLDALVITTGPALFTYRLDGENNPMYDEIALPKCLNNDPEAVISEGDNLTLTRYFYISDADNKDNQTHYYALAVQDLSSRKFVSNAYDTWYLHYYKLPIIFCLVFSMLIFFFVIPMCFKNGETLGKLMFHLGLVNKLGYRYSRLQLIPRFFIMAIVVVVVYVLFGISLITGGILTFLALASYGLAIFTKDHKAIHDFIAGTVVIDKVHSEIFDNVNHEERVRQEIESVQPIRHDVEASKKDETVLYVNENFSKDKNDKEG